MERFTQVENGELTYTGRSEPFRVYHEFYTLNGEMMESGKDYHLKDGDMIRDTRVCGVSREDMQFVFKDDEL